MFEVDSFNFSFILDHLHCTSSSNKMSNESSTTVQVAVRIRPLVENEISRACRNVIDVIDELQQVQIRDTDKAFTFNHVFNCDTKQNELYDKCVVQLISSLFKGYNVTILAYGQTGSGKTFTMGTSYSGESDQGVIPRAVRDIFTHIHDCFTFDFTVTVSFIELYQETCYDLLSQKSREQCVVEIREDNKGVIIPGLTEEPVKSAKEALDYLIKGSAGRATGSTNMNAQSSRSHAIFTVNICMQDKANSANNRTAKFHLVDLAGSERPKKTGATGQTFREGVTINKGLLVLGNVISALGDEKQHSYIPYRDSNLTRLLKDSLGGNSITLMIACVSPADYNLDETLSTLRYADRAKKIKNKPVINQDEKTAEINRLQKQIRQLRLELISQGGVAVSQGEIDQVKKEIEELRNKNRHLTVTLSSTIHEKMTLLEKITIMQTAKESLQSKFNQLKAQYNQTLSDLNKCMDVSNVEEIKMNVLKLQTLQEQMTEIDIEHKKTEDELKNCEIVTDKTFNISNQDVVTESEISERQESHTAQQIALNAELQEVTKKLAMKEHLAQQIADNVCNMIDYKAMEEDKSKIATLEKEKHDLVEQLQNFQGTGSKIAEQRRKRIKELEEQITDLRKRVQEQDRLIKLKEKDEQKIIQLRNEITSMKQIKAKLIRNMRQESEKFRVWKVQREREINKLKEQDRKRQNQIVKMETMHNRQQNVLKRKVEEAAALNKRLKDMLTLRQNVHQNKNTVKEDRLSNWLKQEWDLFTSTVEAQLTLKSLMNNREMLQSELDKLKNTETNETETLEEQQLKDEIEMNCAQILSLQQKLIDLDEENKSKTRWDNIQSMAEAKYCLKTLFTYAEKICNEKYKNEEIQSMYNEVLKKLEQRDLELKKIESSYNEEIAQLQKENEEKTAILLRQLRGISVESDDKDLENRCIIQQETISALEKKNEALLEEIENLKRYSKEMELKITTINDVATEVKTPKHVVRYLRNKISNFLLPPDTPGVESDNINKDPDWRNTPLNKRISKINNSNVTAAENKGAGAIKRTSEGGCTCKKNLCRGNRCGCFRSGYKCSNVCKCVSCLNFDSTDNEQTVDKENDLYKLPGSPQETEMKKQRLFAET